MCPKQVNYGVWRMACPSTQQNTMQQHKEMNSWHTPQDRGASENTMLSKRNGTCVILFTRNSEDAEWTHRDVKQPSSFVRLAGRRSKGAEERCSGRSGSPPSSSWPRGVYICPTHLTVLPGSRSEPFTGCEMRFVVQASVTAAWPRR